ncbi:MAG TPA: hypothetical protein VNO50_16020 [Pyrinomonadaceae bacterium]|nr:hypothetical protein [Pyrinomonadaceae bacterium]
MYKNFGLMFLTAIAAAALLLTTGPSSSAIQRNGNLQITQFHHVVITGDDIRKLPSGESRIIESLGTGSGERKHKTGSLEFLNQNRQRTLAKVGAGHLILPLSNSTGITKVGPGVLQNSANANASLTKELAGTLVLSAFPGVVYEFRNLGPLDFAQIALTPADLPVEQVSFPFGNARAMVQQQRPGHAMQGWPFKRLLIGPAAGIAQVEGWERDLAGKSAPASKYICTAGNSCACNGAADCLSLTQSGSCSSNMNCDGSGAGIKCFCKAK